MDYGVGTLLMDSSRVGVVEMLSRSQTLYSRRSDELFKGSDPPKSKGRALAAIR